MKAELALSAIALLLSVARAIYARQAAAAAKTANRISSHQHKLELLRATREFQGALRVHGEMADSVLVYALLAASDKASLYFSPSVADHLSRYAGAAHRMLVARDSAKAFESASLDPRQKWEDAFSLVDQCRKIEGSLLADLEAETKIVG